MNYKINKYIVEESFLSYAKKDITYKLSTDCYDGINNITFSSNVKDVKKN